MKIEFLVPDADGFVRFDRYFAYLEQHRKSLPAAMVDFFFNAARYSIDGPDTLHDAWLLSAAFNHGYGEDGLVSRTCTLEFLHASHESRVVLSYSGVRSMLLQHAPSMWPDRPIDLLTHELKVLDDRRFTHTFEFDRGVWARIEFSDFSFLSMA
jgi:hypothetical protein